MPQLEKGLYWSIIHAERKKDFLKGWPVLTEALRLAVAAIWVNKLRSVLTLIGVIIGVASVMVVGAAINGFETYVTENVTSALGSNSFLVDRIAGVNLTYEEYLRKIRTNRRVEVAEVQAVSRRSELAEIVAAQSGARIDVHYRNRELFDSQLIGATANIVEISNINLEHGRFYLPFEEAAARSVCVIGWGLVNELLYDVDPIGRYIKINGVHFRVIGVLKKRGSFLGNNMDNEVYIPLNAFQKMYGRQRGVTMRVKARSAGVFEAAQGEVRTLMRVLRNLRPAQEDTFDILSTDEINQSVGQFTGAVAAVVMPVTLISLVVGGIVIMNIMLVSVTERTKEIGIRKAIGATRRDLILQFLLEAGVLGGLGGAIGVVLSYAVCLLIEQTADFTMTITMGYLILSLGVSGVVGMVSGVYPAVKASRLDPIVALATEV